jgi:nucleotide-binding universal stress UspA family protein
MKPSQPLTIFWAVDPFAKDLRAQRESAWALAALTRGQKARIVPVYLHSPAVYGVPLVVPDRVLAQVRAEATEVVDSLRARAGLGPVEPIEIVARPVSTLRQGVSELLKLARARRADLIVVGTHARKGPRRWILGSFAETLADRSEIPLLVLNPEWNRRTDFGRFVFATDFSPESHEAFREVTRMARLRGAKITLFHKVSYDLGVGFNPAFVTAPYYQEVFENQLSEAKALADQWVKEASSQGVEADSYVDFKSAYGAGEAILNYARKKGCVIALASHSGAVERAVFGSTTRKVLRDAKDPVWIVHPVGKRKAAPKPRAKAPHRATKAPPKGLAGAALRA